MLGLHKTILDHEIIETNNPNTLIFVDSSSYMEEPDRPLLEITLPGYNQYFLANYTAREVNIFNSGTIGMNQVYFTDQVLTLPDGIWTIKQKICPYQYVYITKKHMRVTLLLNKLSDIYSKIDLSNCNTKIDRDTQATLVRVHSLIEGSKLIVNINPKKAYDDYRLADKLADMILKKICNNCIN